MTVENDGQAPSTDRSSGRWRRLPVIGNPAFVNADFRRLFAASACNQFGMSGEQVILGLLVFRITQSSAWVGVLLALYYLPLFIAGPLSGVVSDWLDRRRLLRGYELAIAGVLALFAVAVAIGLTALWLLLSAAVIAGTLRALHQPVRMSLAYDLVGGEQIVASLGLLNIGARLGQLAGALIAGSLAERFGSPLALASLALAHGAAFFLLSQLRSSGVAAPVSRAPLRQNLREYGQQLRHNRVLLMLIVITATVEVFGFSFSTALPELAESRFNLGAEGLGMMFAARAVGGIAAGLALAATNGLQRRGMIFLMVIYAFGGGLMLLSAANQFALALVALVVVAFLATASDVLTQSMLQLCVSNELRGRAMGAWALAIGTAPLGHLEMGALAVTVGVANALAINGAALVAVGLLVTLAAPRLRRL